MCALAALVATVGAALPAPSSAAGSPSPIALSAAFDSGARLGRESSIRVALDIDPGEISSPVVGMTLSYPVELGITSSGLGIAACRRPPSDFVTVAAPPRTGLDGCPANSVMGYGSVRAQITVGTLKIPEMANMILLAGPVERRTPRLVTYIDGLRPVGARLIYEGELGSASLPFGAASTWRFPRIPRLMEDTYVSLVRMRLVLGSRRIIYRKVVDNVSVRVRPRRIALPTSCPRRGGFRFRVAVQFEDGRSEVVDSTTPCPPSLAGPR